MGTHNLLAWAGGIIGSIGIVGLIALAIFAPPIAAAIWKAIMSFINWFWSTRLGVGVMVGIAVYYGAIWYQHRVDEARYAKLTAEFKAAQAKRDKDIAAQTEADVRKKLKEEEDDDAEAAKDAAAIAAEVDPDPADSGVPVGPAVAAKLCHLAGRSCSSGADNVQPAGKAGAHLHRPKG